MRNTIKQVSILRQQHVIETLESKINKQVFEIEKINISRRTLAESEASLRDKLKIVTEELEDLKSVHERDIIAIRPILNGYVLSIQENQIELQKLRREVEMSAARLLLVEENNKELAQQCLDKENERVKTNALLIAERQVMSKIRAELASQSRILVAASSSNISHKSYIKDLEQKLRIALENIGDLRKENSDLNGQIDLLKNHNDEMQKELARAISAEKETSRNNRATESLYACQQVELALVQKELDEILQIGYTIEKRDEFEGLKRSLGVARDEISHVSTQLKLANRKIQDLEMKPVNKIAEK